MIVKRIGIGIVAAFAIFGMYSLGGVISQAREDYSNFRKIVQWVALKQQQEEAYRQRQQAATTPAPAAAISRPAPADAGAPSGGAK